MWSPTATSCISASPIEPHGGDTIFRGLPPGEIVEYGGVDVSGGDIVTFAREFDPQPFHLDEEAARATTGGLIASGWHTSALLLRMNCEAFLTRAAALDEAGVEEIRWELPVRPGDRLHVRRHTLAARPRDSGSDEGEVEFLYEIVNQDGLVAMTQRSLLRIKRRSKTGAD
jgi:acyl dehydratase